MDINISDAVLAIAEALTEQALANTANSRALEELSRKLSMSDVCAIKIIQEETN